MRQTMLTQSGAPGHVIGWTNFSHNFSFACSCHYPRMLCHVFWSQVENQYREPNRVNWKAMETMFLESIDLYVKNWSKREQVELKYLSEWKDQ